MTDKKENQTKDWAAVVPTEDEEGKGTNDGGESEIDIAKPALAHPSYEEMEAQLNVAEAKINEYKEKVLRGQAEMDNLHRRMEREVAQTHKYALERFVKEFLPVVDNLERSLEQKGADDLAAVYKGVELTLQGLQKALEKFAIKPIDPLGEAFNPTLHEAMSTQEQADKTPGTVVAVLQKGYLLNDRLVRPALVIVAKAPEKN